jgi:hypothetical protein
MSGKSTHSLLAFTSAIDNATLAGVVVALFRVEALVRYAMGDPVVVSHHGPEVRGQAARSLALSDAQQLLDSLPRLAPPAN